MNIRHANPADLDRIMEIYARAQQFMRESGNPTQWSNVYPTRGLIEDDIARQISYVVTDDTEKVQGVFVFVIGKDRTYAVIRGGAWKNDDPYGTIHRIAASGEVPERSAIGAEGRCVDDLAACGSVLPDQRLCDLRMLQHPLLRADVAGVAALLQLRTGGTVQNKGKTQFHM